MKIRIFSVWGDLSEEFSRRYNRNYFTNGDDYTHAVILNCYIPHSIHTDPDHTIGIAMEPIEYLGLTNQFVEYARNNIGKYFLGEFANKYGSPFIDKRYFCTYMDYPLYTVEKNKIMSIALSQKDSAPGHKYRHELVKEILLTDLPIDIYGRGCYMHGADPRLKGSFENDLVVHQSYLYHIAVENHRRNWYYTEKIINPLLCGTVPIYYGCKNINNIFDNIPIIILTGDIQADMKTIYSICKYGKGIEFDRSIIPQKISFDKIIKEFTT